MQAKLSRYKKAILSCLCILTVAISVCSFSFESKAETSAAGTTYISSNFVEPNYGESSGYLNLLVQDTTTLENNLYTFFWEIVVDSGGTPPVNDASIVEFSYNNSTKIVSLSFSSVTGYFVRAGVLMPNGMCSLMVDGYMSSDTSISYLVGSISSSYTVKSISGKGNYVTNSSVGVTNSYIVLWGNERIVVEEQKESNSWLKKIWESLQEFVAGKPDENTSVPADPEDNLGNMKENEEILLPDTSDAEGSLDVELNSGFGVLTWLVDSFAKLDPGIFSTYLTMLTFGVIALILGR